MCAILFANDPAIDRLRFLKSLSLMTHRGPDATGGYDAIGDIHLGHNRLKILDLGDASNQPFWSADRRHAIVYNGEIYNYRELAARFDIRLRTTSDTELLLNLYLRLGAGMLDHLNGMFAFVIVDADTGSFFAARDRLGVKPLYWWQGPDGRHVLSSELLPIASLLKSPKPDAIGLRQYRKLRTFFNGRTIYEDISMFPAGHYMLDGKLQRFWTLPDGEQDPPGDDELRSLIASAVAYRTLADVPVGSYLSGGLDSSIVAGLAKETHTWTVGMPDDNEFSWGRLAAQHFGTSHHEILVSPEEFMESHVDMVRQKGEPLSVPNEVLLYRMTREVRKLNTVILSGEGADELFFGYDRIFRWAAVAKELNVEDFSRLYAYGSGEDLEIVEDALAPFRHHGSPLAVVAAFFQVAHLHGLLRRLDNATMLCGVEARTPFVDYRLVERMAGVPHAYRMQGNIVKAPLKRVFSDLVPAGIIDRPKVGFPVNIGLVLPKTLAGNSPMDKWLALNMELLGFGGLQ